MREFTRCIAWALGLGAVALCLAMFFGLRLEQADGAWAWLLLLAYLPYHLAVLAAIDVPHAPHLAVVFTAQFAYFLLLVAGARRLMRWRPRPRAPQ